MQPQKFHKITHALVNSGGLLDKAEAALQLSLKTRPQDSQTLWFLGQVCRSQGKFYDAAAAYRQFADLNPNHQLAAYLCALLESQPLPVEMPQPGLWPAPFVYLPNFLPPDQHKRVLNSAFNHQDRLHRSEVGNIGNIDTDLRSSWVLFEHDLEKELQTDLFNRLRAQLPSLMPRLQVKPFAIGHIELQMTMHQAGDFFTIHQDITPQDTEVSEPRLISYVYYFNRTPKPFSGGDLLLYDTDADVHAYETAFTRIVPQDNSLLLFPSHYWHQVTPVQSTTQDIRDGRFTLNGWVHAKSA